MPQIPVTANAGKNAEAAIARVSAARYAASLRRGVRRPECDTCVRLSAEDRNSVSRKDNVLVRSEN